MTNQELIDRYRVLIQNEGLTEKSIEAKCDQDLRLFFQFIVDKKLQELTHDDIEDFMAYCRIDRKNGDQALSRKFSSINAFFKMMIKRDYLDMKNPLDKLDKPKVRKKNRGHIEKDVIEQALEYLEQKGDLRGSAMLSLFFSSGIRLSELRQLNRTTLDFKNMRFPVKGKGQQERTCIFFEDASWRVLKYLNSRTDDNPALFYSRQKNRISNKAIQNFIKNTFKAIGYEGKAFPHKIRHSTAMDLMNQNILLEDIQMVLGHSNVSTTQIYAKNDISRVQAKINNVHKGNDAPKLRSVKLREFKVSARVKQG